MARRKDLAIADMTVQQAMEVRAMAIAKGVSRDQIQAGRGLLAKALDAIKSGGRIKELPAIEHPSWGEVVFVDSVPVRLDCDWSIAVDEAGPDTPAGYFVRQMGHLYLPIGAGVVRANFVLVPLAGGTYQKALDWAKQYGLPHASPRHIFALAKHKPNLHREFLKRDPAYVVSPLEQTFGGNVCGVWFSCERRGAHAYWAQAQSVGDEDAWVAFLRE